MRSEKEVMPVGWLYDRGRRAQCRDTSPRSQSRAAHVAPLCARTAWRAPRRVLVQQGLSLDQGGRVGFAVRSFPVSIGFAGGRSKRVEGRTLRSSWTAPPLRGPCCHDGATCPAPPSLGMKHGCRRHSGLGAGIGRRRGGNRGEFARANIAEFGRTLTPSAATWA